MSALLSATVTYNSSLTVSGYLTKQNLILTVFWLSSCHCLIPVTRNNSLYLLKIYIHNYCINVGNCSSQSGLLGWRLNLYSDWMYPWCQVHSLKATYNGIAGSIVYEGIIFAPFPFSLACNCYFLSEVHFIQRRSFYTKNTHFTTKIPEWVTIGFHNITVLSPTYIFCCKINIFSAEIVTITTKYLKLYIFETAIIQILYK